MTAMFRTDKDRTLAIELRRLLMRLQNGDGEDPALGADIIDAFELPFIEIGDPIACIECAMWLAWELKINELDALGYAVETLKKRCREGWKSPHKITHADVARVITGFLLKGKVAKLEGTPA